MATWLLRRVLRTVFAVWVLASGVFLLSRQDAARVSELALPEATDLSAAHSSSAAREAARQAVGQRLGLDIPLFYASRTATGWQWHPHNQYHSWLRQCMRGELGVSFRTGQPVAQRLGAALAYTLPLTSTALLLAVGLMVGLAQWLARPSRWQQLVRRLLAAVQAMPLFVVALLLLLLFANPEVLAWFPSYGMEQATSSDLSWDTRAASYAMHLALPVAALVLTALPELTLQLDAALAQELQRGYVATARAKGLSEPAVIRHHALRNALLPTLTQVAELLPALVGGAVVVEVVFGLPGMGRVLAEAAATRDYPVLVGGVLLTGAARLLALLLADLCYFWADPRIRWQS